MVSDPRRHLRFGWATVALFAIGGLTLEALHGFKLGLYLDVGNETRRLLWTLAHAHGTLLGLLHIGWGATLAAADDDDHRKRRRRVGKLLRAATVLLPGGFFLGGVWTYGSDPGIAAVIMVPLGGLALVAALVQAARAV